MLCVYVCFYSDVHIWIASLPAWKVYMNNINYIQIWVSVRYVLFSYFIFFGILFMYRAIAIMIVDSHMHRYVYYNTRNHFFSASFQPSFFFAAICNLPARILLLLFFCFSLKFYLSSFVSFSLVYVWMLFSVAIVLFIFFFHCSTALPCVRDKKRKRTNREHRVKKWREKWCTKKLVS